MGRPKKDRDAFTARLAIRLHPETKSEIERRAKEAGLPVSEFAREMLQTGRVVVRQNKIDERFIFELNKSGVNLNQIAAAQNAGRELPALFFEVLKTQFYNTQSFVGIYFLTILSLVPSDQYD